MTKASEQLVVVTQTPLWARTPSWARTSGCVLSPPVDAPRPCVDSAQSDALLAAGTEGGCGSARPGGPTFDLGGPR